MSTPMMKQWKKFKEQYPEDTILFFQAGDFYELYYQDAKLGHKELNITLTARKLKNGNIPMAGVPLHAAEKYILQLVRKGYKIAIADQVEDAQASKGIVKRDVVQVITPGTIFGDQLLDGKINNYLVSLVRKGSHIGLAMVDISTGEFLVTEFTGTDALEELKDELNRLTPVEILISENLVDDADLNSIISHDQSIVLTPIDTYYSSYEETYKLLTSHFGTLSLDGFGIESFKMGICAAGMIIHYLRETQKSNELYNITKIVPYSLKEYMMLDDQTLRSLEVFRNLRDGTSQFTLLEILDRTHTPMGSRLLKKWLRHPLNDKEKIQERLDAVEVFITNSLLHANLRDIFTNISDIERIISKVGLGKANGRDLLALKDSLLYIPELKDILNIDSKLISTLKDHLYDLSDLVQLIERSIKEECPPSVREGNIIKSGFNENLDELQSVLSEGTDWILKYEKDEKRRTRFDKLKVGFNNVFGYYIEITQAALRKGKVPEDYIRKQTLVNSERFITPELKQWEDKILGADEKIKNLEYELFCEIRQEIAKQIDKIQENAQSIAILDVISTFAEIASQNQYIKPNMVDSDDIHIEGGRHPVVERIIGEENFIPNDTHLDSHENQILIITGPNMSGKCVRGDTRIFSDKGILPISYFQPFNNSDGTFEELAINVVGINGITSTSHFYTDGVKPSIRIETKMGYYIEGSLNHPVLARTPSGEEIWKKLSDISDNDYLIIKRKNDLWGSDVKINYQPPTYKRTPPMFPLPREINVDLAYLMGLLIGDGSLTYTHSFNFTNKDEFLKKTFQKVISELFNYKAKTKKQDTEHFVSSLYLRDFLKFLGLDYVQSYHKEVPESILKAPKNIVKAFLQGLFDTDGTADNKYGNVTLSTSSSKLAKQVHIILLNFGIISSLKVKKTSRRPSYNVRITGLDSIKFHDKIGFRLPKKAERKKLASSLHMTNVDSIPYLGNVLKQIQKEIVENRDLIPHKDKLKYNKSIGNIFYTYLRLNRNLSYFKLQELIDYCCKYKISHQNLENIAKNHYFYDKIVKIEHSKASLFDFSIPNGHAFVGNGFVNHNSTYLRQVALIVLMAQIGSFVPAQAKLGICDRIFTRVGAWDFIAMQQSTFMVEMIEVANILNNATNKSLIILDEVGRGTSTYDGMALAWSITEFLHQSSHVQGKTLFATHYHQLNQLAEYYPRIKNYQFTVKRKGQEILFLHKILPGGTDRSYGVEVARLAGLPQAVVTRAKEILDVFESSETPKVLKSKKLPTSKPELTQLTLFDVNKINSNKGERLDPMEEISPEHILGDKIINELKNIDLDHITPLNALNKLHELKKKLNEEDNK